MPDILTDFGTGQMMGFGCGLLLIFWLRARRYAGSIMPLYAIVWLAACIGLAVKSVMEDGQVLSAILPRLSIAAIVPLVLAMLIQRRMRRT